VGYLYIGRSLSKVQAIPDETEFFEIAIIPFEQVLQMVNRSEIRDSMTVIAVLQAARLRGS
jgi:ADP-ribose pyrophosphatase